MLTTWVSRRPLCHTTYRNRSRAINCKLCLFGARRALVPHGAQEGIKLELSIMNFGPALALIF
ncbi:hypothetical protein RSAG8_08017, partial [Rhizoctonia solani AG-8 WAC10335]